MKILLFAMPDIIPHFSDRIWRAPNLALGSIAANVEGDHEIAIGDLILKRKNLQGAILEALASRRPQLVGLSAMSFQYSTACKVARVVKEFDPKIRTVLGGYHATLMAEEIAGSGEGALFDFIIRGEGETAFNYLVQALEKGRDFDGVKGLSWKRNGSFVHNERGALEDLSKIKIPQRRARIWKGYRFNFWQADVLETSRGCRMRCNFCSMNHMYGATFRTYAIERVLSDIADSKAHGARYIAFADDNITLHVKRFEELCEAITRAGHNDIHYIIQASCAGIASSPTLAPKMAKAGFNIVFLGIENISARNLKAMRKGNILEVTKRAIELLHSNGILIVGGLIVGAPEDNVEDIHENYEFFDAHDIDFFGDQVITPYPKTAIREALSAQGLVTNPDDYSHYNGFWANVRTKYLTREELQFHRWRERKRYSTFFKTTPCFKKNFPFASLARRLFLIPAFRLRDYFRNRLLSERERFLRDTAKFEKLNDLL